MSDQSKLPSEEAAHQVVELLRDANIVQVYVGVFIYLHHTDEGRALVRAAKEAEVMRHELAAARARYGRIMKVFHGIHALLSPEAVEHDGKRYIFSPQDPALTLSMWHELSARIRAIPDEIDAIARREQANAD